MQDGFFDDEDMEFFGFKKKKKTGFDDFEDDFFKGFGKGGFGGNSFGTTKSDTTSTQVVNGKRVSITKTVTRGPDGKTKEEVKEEIVDPSGHKEVKHYVDGKPVTHAIKQ